MTYRKLNIDPELIPFADNVLTRNMVPFETAGDGKLMAPLSDVEEKALIEMAARDAARKDDAKNLYRLPVLPGREKDLMNELARNKMPYRRRTDGSIVIWAGSLEEWMWDDLEFTGILKEFEYGWDEAYADRVMARGAERQCCATTKFLWPYVKDVLERGGIAFNATKEDEEFGIIYTDCEIPWNVWVEIVVDALCERQKELMGTDVPVYSFRTLTNPEKLKELQKLNGTDKYEVLWCDRKRWAHMRLL